MVIDIDPKFYSALSPPYDVAVKVTDLEISSLSFTSKFLRSCILEISSLSFTSKFLRSCIFSTSFQIILFILFISGIQIAIEDVLHPKLYPVQCLPSPSNPPPPTHHYDLDFKVIVLFFI